MRCKASHQVAWHVLLALAIGWPLALAHARGEEGSPGYSPYAGRDYPENLYWGDTHVHTNLSADAYGMGNVLTPEDAYAFAKGRTVLSNTGQPARLSRPLGARIFAD